MTAPPPARTLDFGASATASLLVKMTITYGMSERHDQMITYSLFEKLMRNEMPQDQGDLGAILLIEDRQDRKPHQQSREQLDLRETGDERETE